MPKSTAYERIMTMLKKRDSTRAQKASCIYSMCRKQHKGWYESSAKQLRRNGAIITGKMPGEHQPYYRCGFKLNLRKEKSLDWDTFVVRQWCTCPDWGSPCKHVGALFLLFILESESFTVVDEEEEEEEDDDDDGDDDDDDDEDDEDEDEDDDDREEEEKYTCRRCGYHQHV
eukprot:TRINITY_DN11173_c0_g1_i2.p1 TRINITY_DN11173_c0_g1~~TRINITY_DN11173_c0_g1_i2.p1  ORF type:complete len:182 (-),score=34.36 TRINITY_DN11173_c0_g1_i2:98-613(-)